MFLFDLGLGLILSVLTGFTLGREFSVLFLVVGIVSSIIPDWDMIPHLIIKRGKLDEWAHKHRDISHYPLLTIPVFSLISYFSFGPHYAVLTGIVIFVHYILDTFGIGWGVKWLWPFSSRYFSYDKTIRKDKRWFAWTKKEQDEMVKNHGNPEWASNKKQIKLDVIVLVVGLVATLFWIFF